MVVSFLTGALAHLGLGRAWPAIMPKPALPIDFLALWKDADPDIPALKQAKRSTPSWQGRACHRPCGDGLPRKRCSSRRRD